MLKNCTGTHDLSWHNKCLELKSHARVLLYLLMLMKVNDRRKQNTWKKGLPPTLTRNFSTYSNSLAKIALSLLISAHFSSLCSTSQFSSLIELLKIDPNIQELSFF